MALQERVIHPPQRYLRNTKHCILWLYFVIREVVNNSSRNFWKIITRNVKYGYWGSKIVRFKTYLFPNPQGGRRSGWCLKTVIIRNRQLPITPTLKAAITWAHRRFLVCLTLHFLNTFFPLLGLSA